jgi:serine-type D-Ala-D-Ala carboxypeptidase/endopeptidase (penicillin-binding protein 4)
MPPASVTKVPTALYALEALGADHRFATRLLATGPVVNGRIEGDLVLAGTGDPTLDTDGLGQLAADLKAAGIREVAGEFRIDDTALPAAPLDRPRPARHVGYNPTIGAVNLNYNRVHFEWKRAAGGFQVTMEARAARYSPRVEIARVDLVDRSAARLHLRGPRRVERWTVARAALGNGGRAGSRCAARRTMRARSSGRSRDPTASSCPAPPRPRSRRHGDRRMAKPAARRRAARHARTIPRT